MSDEAQSIVGGENAPVEKKPDAPAPKGPSLLRNCVHASQLLYQWDGSEIVDVYEKI